MTTRRAGRHAPSAAGAALIRDTRGAAAVEIAIVIWPFLFVLLMAVQMGLYYMTQSALDAGVNTTASALRDSFNGTATPNLPSAATLKASVVANAGALIFNTGNLAVEIRQLSALSAASVPIADGTADYGSAATTLTAPLALRAQSSVVILAPGMSALTRVTSTAIVRRQGR